MTTADANSKLVNVQVETCLPTSLESSPLICARVSFVKVVKCIVINVLFRFEISFKSKTYKGRKRHVATTEWYLVSQIDWNDKAIPSICRYSVCNAVVLRNGRFV